MPLAERPRRGGIDGEAFHLVRVDGELCRGLVGPVQATADRPLLDPAQNFWCEGFWDLRRSPRSPADRKAIEPLLVTAMQPPLQGPHADSRVLSHVAVRPSARSYEDGLTAHT